MAHPSCLLFFFFGKVCETYVCLHNSMVYDNSKVQPSYFNISECCNIEDYPFMSQYWRKP